MDDIMLLKVGRHIRPSDNFKLIISREEGENNYLQGYKKEFTSIYTVSHKGPLTLLDGEATTEEIQLAARIVARFSQGREAAEVVVKVDFTDGHSSELAVSPLPPTEIPDDWYI